jgi:regulator of sigma E protease
MIFTIFVVIISLLFLVTAHELGHFLLAKKFDVKVEEFGIGIPPKIIGKKIGETEYSLNLLPIGAFVKMYGEEERVKEPRSFSQKPIWQRVLIILGGVISFWIISIIFISIIATIWGIPTVVEDAENLGSKDFDPRVEITQLVSESPADKAGLELGDIIRQARTSDFQLSNIDKVEELVVFTEGNKGKEIILIIQRGKNIFEVSLTPRLNPPPEEGPMGIGLARIVTRLYLAYQAPIQGFLVTKNITVFIVSTFARIIKMLVERTPIPKGTVQVKGILGIGQLGVQILESGVDNYLFFLAQISVYLALFNILPIPALDGGKILFLMIEKARGKPVSQRVEERVTAFFFILIMALGIIIIIRDIITIF